MGRPESGDDQLSCGQSASCGACSCSAASASCRAPTSLHGLTSGTAAPSSVVPHLMLPARRAGSEHRSRMGHARNAPPHPLTAPIPSVAVRAGRRVGLPHPLSA